MGRTIVVAAWLGMAGVFAETRADRAVVAVVPEQTDEILANPGMGWQTFHCTRKQDRRLPGWIPTTTAYVRFGWNRAEPAPGKIDHALFDRWLADARDSDQKLALRIMCCSPYVGRPYHPSWLKGVGGRELSCRFQGGRRLTIPDLDDPIVLRRHLDFIRRFGARYDGHTDLDHVDLGSVGWWGEWHMSATDAKMPGSENQKQIVDAYLAAFRKTPLLMLVGGGDMLRHSVERGAGWRADCLGDWGEKPGDWNHMRRGYPQWIRAADVADAGRRAPVAWETCWDVRKWVEQGWSLRDTFNYALALHGSYVNNKSAPLPPGRDVRPEIERFLRRLGYRLVLTELKHSPGARPGESLRLAMRWRNVGSAPCYRPYRLAYRLSDEQGFEKTFVGRITVDRWAPGRVEVFTEKFFRSPPDLPPGDAADETDEIFLPENLPAGDYVLSLAVVGLESIEPVVQLGIKGRAPDGWYPLSRVKIAP